MLNWIKFLWRHIKHREMICIIIRGIEICSIRNDISTCFKLMNYMDRIIACINIADEDVINNVHIALWNHFSEENAQKRNDYWRCNGVYKYGKDILDKKYDEFLNHSFEKADNYLIYHNL